ncbi:hypothetical protein MKEN_00149100 [Mycena kentingensis (nom. inval.)]|nr:hypothetical protein MKEN_00149100 [Mycena kentingensis (nom. inval.)]
MPLQPRGENPVRHNIRLRSFQQAPVLHSSSPPTMRSPLLRMAVVGTLLILLAGLYTISSHPMPFVVPSLCLSPSSPKQLYLEYQPSSAPEPLMKPVSLPPPTLNMLPVASRTLIINLERRTDRRESMEVLRAGIDPESAWTYLPALESRAPWTVRVLHRIRELREAIFATYPSNRWVYDTDGPRKLIELPFSWPDPMPPHHPHNHSDPFDEVALERDFPSPKDPFPPLTWAEKDYALVPWLPDEPLHLTRSVVACYRSHVAALEVAAQQTDGAPTLIMEDDVDVEVDIRSRLDRVWGALPDDWDMVYLGHCWSEETENAPLHVPDSQKSFAADDTYPRIHPSNGPLCTHAYIVSPAGAARLLSHLTLPSYAYSRPVDNAIARLVKTGRIKSFTVVPNVVIQMEKRGVSDVNGRVDNTGGWIANLANGFFSKQKN